MPKRFRLYFRFNREVLRKLPRLAWETVVEVCRAVLGRDDVTPGPPEADRRHPDTRSVEQLASAYPHPDHLWRVHPGRNLHPAAGRSLNHFLAGDLAGEDIPPAARRGAHYSGSRRADALVAALVRLRRKVDPLLCPKCGGTMAIVSFIEKRDQGGFDRENTETLRIVGAPGIPSASPDHRATCPASSGSTVRGYRRIPHGALRFPETPTLPRVWIRQF